jgi:hypothetical protein
VPQAIATGFLLLAILVIVSAEQRAAAVVRRLEAHVVVTAKIMNLRLFAALLSLGATALIVAIWTVRTSRRTVSAAAGPFGKGLATALQQADTVDPDR